MPKNIVLLSDGTGNAAAKVWRTNVWRTYQALELRDGKVQIAQYDDGVGTSSFKPLALLGGAFGFGLKSNVLRLYKFLSANYTPGDKIYCFGFSRGAYTIRVVASLIVTQGLVPKGLTGADFELRALDKYRAYRADRFKGYAGSGWSLQLVWMWRRLRNAFIYLKRWVLGQQLPNYTPAQRPPDIEFLGVWDTVAAYGLPVQEMTRGFDLWFWPIAPTDRVLHPNVKRACHALAVDDERTTFHPLLWTETVPNNPVQTASLRKRLSQVWFAGMHSNVGGGYPDDALSYVSLDWMMDEAEKRGLEFESGPRADVKAAASKAKLSLTLSPRDDRVTALANGKMYDSRSGSAAYFRYGPRHVTNLCNFYEKKDPRDNVSIDIPLIHHTVLDRIRHGGDRYAPIGLPGRYSVVGANGAVMPPAKGAYEHHTQASDRFNRQESVWNLVWRRRVLYFATLFLVLFILFRPYLPSSGYYIFDALNALYIGFRYLGALLSPVFSVLEPLVSGLLNVLSAFIPSFLAEWLKTLAADRAPFLAQLSVLGVLMWRSSSLKTAIRTDMRGLWTHLQAKPKPVKVSSRPTDLLTRLRHWLPYINFHRRMRRWILPFVFGICFLGIFVYWAGVLSSRVVTTGANIYGYTCAYGEQQKADRVKGGVAANRFETNNPCWPTGYEMTAGKRYCIRIVRGKDDKIWKDDQVETGLEGITFAEAGFWQRLGIPLRRQVFEPYFRPIARIGQKGDDEYALAPQSAQTGIPTLDSLHVEITARTSGQLYLFVNDVLLPTSRYALYDNNSGTATVTVEPLGDSQRCRPPEQ